MPGFDSVKDVGVYWSGFINSSRASENEDDVVVKGCTVVSASTLEFAGKGSMSLDLWVFTGLHSSL